MSDARPVPWRFIIAAAAITIILLVVVAVAGIDISAMADFERDVIVMRAPLPPYSDDRYHDPSAYSLWLPSDLFVWDSIRSGQVPLWNRLQGGGYSVTNAIHEGALHPLRWLTAAVPRHSAPSALIVMILAVAFTGMYVLARAELGYSPLASALSAIIFTFSAVLISFVHFSGGILPLAHIPWLVFFLRRGHVLGLVITLTSLFMSGHPLLEACAVLTAGGVALADAVNRRSVRPVSILAGSSAVAVLLAAPALLPPLLSRPELWTYKTATAQGSSYFTYTFSQWQGALEAMILDAWADASCCIDLDGFYLYAGIAAIVLAAIGAVAIAEKRIAVLLFLSFLFTVPGPWMAPLANIRPVSFFKPWYLIGSFAFLLAWVAGAGFDSLWRSKRPLRVLAGGLAVLVAVTYLLRAAQVLEPRISRTTSKSEAVEFLRRQPGPFRVIGLWGQTHMPNSSRITGIEDLRLVGPILTIRYHLWWQAVDPEVLTRAYPTTRITDRLDSPLVADFNVKYFIQSRLVPTGTFRLDRDERRRDELLARPLSHFAVVFRTPWVDIRENPSARPRAHFGDGSGSAVVRYPNDRSVVIDARSDKGGLVVLHDSFAEGWRARVDGKAAEIVPVNILSRGVMVPAGAHRIEMEYTPRGFAAAVAISMFTIILSALAAWRGSRSRRAAPESETPS